MKDEKKKHKKNLQFYVELIVVTIAIWVTANLWEKAFTKAIERKFPHSITALFVAAIVISVVSILALFWLFGKGKGHPGMDHLNVRTLGHIAEIEKEKEYYENPL